MRRWRLRLSLARLSGGRGRFRWSPPQAVKLHGNRPVSRDQRDTRYRLQQSLRFGIDEIRPQDVDCSLREFHVGSFAGPTTSYRGFDRKLQVLHVGRSSVIDDDEIDS